ncbi:G-D-S-L family lipolytic protein [Flavobacterium sp. Sd200]|uniref:G-D-S-L family lipolytic protein n=1 Tax=Flavobacterium sp. Sd200 TaxID=2692211 RepID=UPI00136B81D7|nr:G-D-S-L family lipolytic protein [Flavobacterium sp. Sd200]MXN92047.1 G-D-S-L family lipolytic protein [Flavobacterium sp. Sd200]
MKKRNTIIYLAILAAGFAACEPEFENELSNADFSAGEADFSTYVAIGNSLTAGYMDGTMSRIGQTYSFPNILAQQFKVVGGGNFTQPSYAEDVNNLGGINGLPGFPTRLILDASVSKPEPIAGTSTVTLTAQQSAFNNMGVPGAKSFHFLAAGYGNAAGLAAGMANPYYVRMATSATSTVLGDALSLNPTFFTDWVGDMDVLAYATSGGVGVDRTGNMNPATYGSNDITDPTVFANVYSTIVNGLTAGGAKGVVCTIPNVTSIPYFTTVPYNPVALDAATATALNAGFAQYNGGLQVARAANLISAEEVTRRTINFAAGNNAVTIVDESLTNLSALGLPSYRQATASDLIVLPASSFIGTRVNDNAQMINGVSVPLADQWVLIPSEITLINNATTNFNNSIKSIAAAKNLAVADMNAILNTLVSGLRTDDGQIYTANYFSVSTVNTVLFSLDGVHPNARGYALVANEIIKVINEHYKAKLPAVTAGYYPGATVLPTN